MNDDEFAIELGRALQAEGDAVMVDSTAAWDKVRLAAERRRPIRMSRTAGVAVLAAAALVIAALGVASVMRDDGQRVGVIGEGDSSTTAPPTTAVAGDAVFPGIWPFASEAEAEAYASDPGTRMFYDAEATALEFAREYLGMPEPVAEPAGDHFSVRPRAGSPMTTVVRVQQVDDDGPWTVVGSAATNIEVDRPAPGDEVGTVIAVSGRSSSYEAHVDVEVRQDGQTRGEALGRGYVMGGALEMAPFAGDITIDAPTEGAGAVILSTASAEDGHLQEATVVRVAFGEGGQGSDAVTRFSVFFHRGDDLLAVPRETTRTPGVLRAALESLFAGPRPEDGRGVTSLFSQETADLLAGVSIGEDGAAVVDIRRTVDNASTSAGSQAFLAELNATVFQFPTVERIEYRLAGSCDAFWQWLQYGDCRAVPRPAP